MLFNTIYNIFSENPNKPGLIIMVGISGSGKSTCANKLKEYFNTHCDRTVEIISSDAIREEILNDVNDQSQNELVFSTVHKRIKECCKNNGIAIADATNLGLKSRKAYFNCVKKLDAIKIAYIINTPYEQCLINNANRDRNVPEEVINRQFKSFNLPVYGEGFNYIFFNSLNLNALKNKEFDTIEDVAFNMMKGFDQKNSNHTRTLDEHCKLVGKAIEKKYPGNKELVRAAYLHDIGKLFTYAPKPNNPNEYNFINHANCGTYYLMTHIDQLKLKRLSQIYKCLLYINYHMIPFVAKGNKKVTEKWQSVLGNDIFNILVEFNKIDEENCA